MNGSNFKSIYDAAQQYKDEGLDPLPIPHIDGHPSKGPRSPGWQIAAANGHSLDQFNGQCNVGILLAGSNNITDVDADSQIAIAIAHKVLPGRFPNTRRFGRESKPNAHSIYLADESLPSEPIKDPLPQADDPTKCEMIIELRCLNKDGTRGHQTVFPPSVNYDPKTGIEEQVEFDPLSGEMATVSGIELRDAVRWIGAAALLAKHFPSSGGRHSTILALAGIFARANKPEDYAVEFISCAYKHSAGFNNDLGKVESDVRGLYRTLKSPADCNLYGYPTLIETIPKKLVDKVLALLGIESKRSAQSSLPSGQSDGRHANHAGSDSGDGQDDRNEHKYALTDTGNGQWLVYKYAGEIRYCHDAQSWFCYDGVRWQEGEMAVRELAKQRGNVLRQQAYAIEKPEPNYTDQGKEEWKAYKIEQSALHHWANRSENAEGIRGTLFAASSDPRILCSRSAFDQKHNLLNVPNGIIDLYTGKLLEHDASLMLTMLCPTEFHPDAKSEAWDSTLAALTRKHPDLLPFLQVVAGYSTQGNKTEERIFSLQGVAHTGKGTLITALSSTLGEGYLRTIAAETVLKQSRSPGAASGDIARLNGSRIVIVSELEKGNRLQESMLKSMSGNDTVVARGMFKGELEICPTWQFVFQTNNRLGFDSTDSGNRRRYVEIPFDNVLTNDPLVKFDASLKGEMKTDKTLHEAVLAWIVEGCVRWRKEGLQIPESVTMATEELFASNDFLSDFVGDCCIIGLNEKVAIAEMSLAYEQHCRGLNEEPARGRTFNHMCEERGFQRKQATIAGRNCKAWHGIRLKTPEESRTLIEVAKFIAKPMKREPFFEDADEKAA